MDWVASRTLAYLKAFYAPEATFVRDLRGPSYLIPFCILAVVLVGLTSLQAPYHLHWTEYRLESAGADGANMAASLEMMRRSRGLYAAFVPMILLLRWLCLASVLWLAASLFVLELSFSTAANIIAYSYTPIVFRDGIIYLILHLRGLDAVRRPDGLEVPIGLNLVLPSLPQPWAALAANINLFEAWFIMLLTIGVSMTAQVPLRKSLAVSLASWLMAVLFQFGLVWIGVKLQAGLAY
jgi:hypothetical protein